MRMRMRGVRRGERRQAELSGGGSGLAAPLRAALSTCHKTHYIISRPGMRKGRGWRRRRRARRRIKIRRSLICRTSSGGECNRGIDYIVEVVGGDVGDSVDAGGVGGGGRGGVVSRISCRGAVTRELITVYNLQCACQNCHPRHCAAPLQWDDCQKCRRHSIINNPAFRSVTCGC